MDRREFVIGASALGVLPFLPVEAASLEDQIQAMGEEAKERLRVMGEAALKELRTEGYLLSSNSAYVVVWENNGSYEKGSYSCVISVKYDEGSFYYGHEVLLTKEQLTPNRLAEAQKELVAKYKAEIFSAASTAS